MKLTSSLIILLTLLLASMSAHASISTNYGSHEAVSVWYNDVSETTDAGAYRAPIVTGDTLSFVPLGVKAESSDGGLDTNTAQLAFDIQAKAGKYVAGLLLSEEGDFSMQGLTGTDATYVDVTANFAITISEVDGASITPVTDNLSMTFSPNADGTFELITDGGGGSSFFNPYQGAWDGTIYIDLFEVLDNHSVPYNAGGGVTLANLSLENILTADSESGTSSFIQKKVQSDFTITSNIIPEPASLLLMVGTTSFFAFFRRRFIG